MRVVRIDYQKVPDLPPTACAIGYFDGLHRGHQALIAAALRQAADLGLDSAVLTFDPDPWQVLKPGTDLSHLSSLADKTRMLEAMGVDLFYVVTFSAGFAALSTEAFHAFLASLNIRELICGFDFTYGSRGAGNTESLRQCPYFHTQVVLEVSSEEQKISSTRIEGLVRKGEVEKADGLLGYLYSLAGRIEHGYQRGRKMGFPTANLAVDSESVVPKAGVYAGYVMSGARLWPAMINIGSNPTFQNPRPSIEAHILDQDLDLYGQPARFFFAARIRGEQKFSSVEALKEQLSRDSLKAKALLRQTQKLLAPTAKLWSLEPVNAILFR